jgi:hypothetical protein
VQGRPTVGGALSPQLYKIYLSHIDGYCGAAAEGGYGFHHRCGRTISVL